MKLLRDQAAALRTHSPVAYPAGMSRGSLCRALHLGLLATLPGHVTCSFDRFLRLLVAILAALVAVSPAPTFAAEGNRTPKPAIEIANPGKCVAPVDEMRRNHMDMLKHQRDRSVRQGIRGEAASLNACIECHADRKSGSVLGGDGNFCQGCHSYAAVKLDCFECHQPKAGFKAAGVKP